MKQKGNVAETPRYPLIQESLAVIRQRTDKVFLYERINAGKNFSFVSVNENMRKGITVQASPTHLLRGT